MEKWLYLISGGALGTVSRYVLVGVMSHRFGTTYPYGTLAVNLIGCFVIGFLDVLFEKKFLMIHNYRIFLFAGFCGAFTTFSALILEISDFLKENEYLHAFGYVFVSVVLGLLIFKLGAIIADFFLAVKI